jgi:hypothetical protein
MSTLTTHTTATRATPSGSNIGLCKFNTTSKAIEVSDGSNWLVYDYDLAASWPGSSTYSVSLDGSNDYVSVGNHSEYNFGSGGTDSAFSISAWVNMTDATDFIVVSKDDGTNRQYSIRFVSDKIHFYLLGGGGYIGRLYNTAITSDQGSWIHVGFTYDGSKSDTGIKIYRNGTRVDNTNYSGGSYVGMSSTSASFNIGRQGIIYSNGYIDEVAIFGSELSSTDMGNIYNSGTPASLASYNPISWWSMGDQTGGQGTTAYDIQGLHNGSLLNGASFASSSPP